MAVEYRTFHNADPPRFVRLWEACNLGRGAAEGFDTDAFEEGVFAQPYFDRNGLIFAEQAGDLIGFVHAGFSEDRQTGIICAIGVLPQLRRDGIGTELLNRAEEYLRSHNVQSIQAGQAAPNDPYYFGLYGGSQLSGFLKSDPDAAPFFTARGYAPAETYHIYQRDIARPNDPVSVKLMGIRRKTQLAITDEPEDHGFWWMTRYGRHDYARFVLQQKRGGDILAGVSITDLGYYFGKWNERAIGLFGMHVADDQRRQGYGQALLIEVCKRLRQELITRIELHASSENEAALATFKAAAFEQVDEGVVYRKHP